MEQVFNFWEKKPICEVVLSPIQLISKENCDKIISFFDNHELLYGSVGDAKNIETSIRSVELINRDKLIKEQNVFLDQVMNGIFEKISTINNFSYGYKLTHLDGVQFARYSPGHHYNWHQDCTSKVTGNAPCRKLSFTILLNDRNSFTGGDFEYRVDVGERSVDLEAGHICLFPSFVQHRVTEVTYGKRYAIFGWIMGPRWK